MHPDQAMTNLGDTYLFIDGNYLQRACIEAATIVLGEANACPSIRSVKERFGADKVFYYDSVDDRPRKVTEIIDGRESIRRETEAETKARVARVSGFLQRTDEIDDVHVVRGTVTGRDGNRRQKEIDVKLTVDALMHAVRRNMRHALVLAGDRDFRPLVRALVELGINVTVIGHERASSELRVSADRFRLLRVDALLGVLDPQSLANALPRVQADYSREEYEYHKPEDRIGILHDRAGQRREVRSIGRASHYFSLQISPGVLPGRSMYFDCPRDAGQRAVTILEGMIEYQFGARPVWP